MVYLFVLFKFRNARLLNGICIPRYYNGVMIDSYLLWLNWLLAYLQDSDYWLNWLGVINLLTHSVPFKGR